MELEALSQSNLRESLADVDLAQGVRAYLQEGRVRLRSWHRQGAGGRALVGAYTTLMDRLICGLFEQATAEYRRYSSGMRPVCAVIAQGGYGRRELNPESDLDLLFLHTNKLTPHVETVTEKVLYALWDAGLQVGHAMRNVPECIRLAKNEMKVRTALLDARYLCGEAALSGELEKAVEEQLVQRSGEAFIREKLEDNRTRHERYGGSVYLLEPEIKEGEGGLRDIHTALWIARVKRNVRRMEGLADSGILSARELEELITSQDFLLRVRNELHFLTGKHQDQLTFELQERIAPELGFGDEGKVRAVEAFMRSYYLHAAQVSRLSSLVINCALEERERGWWRVWSPGREIRPGIRLHRKTLSITDPGLIAAEPGILISIFHDAQKQGAEIGYKTREILRRNTELIDDSFRRSAAGNLPFFEILKWKDRVYETLKEMHACGVLGAFIPEFGRLLCMALHDLYHIYTVDQHSLRLIGELERLKAGEFREAFPLLTQLARDVEKVEVLYLALLFHDIGKGLGGGHSETGSQIAKTVARRMRLNADDTAQLEFLVRYHLVFASTAFRRDLEDEKTITDFAALMGNVSNLRMLYLLTYCDMRSVGPDVWNNWKGSLLEELYVKTLEVLASQEKGEVRRQDRRSRVRRTKVRLLRGPLREAPRERVKHFFESMPERYFLSTPEDEIPGHFELMEQLSEQTYVCTVRHFPESQCSKMAICTRDRPGLFASITGVFAALGMDILSARIATRRDGLILDVFRISHGGKTEMMMEERKWQRVRETLEQVLSGGRDVARLVADSERPSLLRKRAPKVSTMIQIDNEASAEFTVVEVYTQDRIGVLFAITYALHRLGVSIHIAKISTNVDQVADVFYVTDESGAKIRDEERLESIRRDLTAALSPQNEREAQPAN